MKKILIYFVFSLFISVTHAQTPNAFEVMEKVFVGNPSKNAVKPYIDKVAKMYGYPLNNDNYLKIANMLFNLRKESKSGVTEMQILKHVVLKGSTKISLSQQATISSVQLE